MGRPKGAKDKKPRKKRTSLGSKIKRMIRKNISDKPGPAKKTNTFGIRG